MNLANLKFTPGNILDQLAALQARVDALERNLLSPVITPSNGVFTGDVYNVAWTDYSADSTIVGWSSFTAQQIFYKRVGNLIILAFRMTGTSDATTTSFTVPFANSNTVSPVRQVVQIQDNGTFAIGYLTLAAAASLVTLSPTAAGGVWTASGTKQIVGQFWYEAA